MATPVSAGLPINNLINVNQPASSTPTTASNTAAAAGASSSSGSSSSSSSTSNATSQLGENAFLTILTTELQNQDPLNPMDDTQSIAQLANFSTLQSQTELQNDFQSFQQNFAVMQSASLIGQTVTASDPNTANSSVTGKVSGVTVTKGTPYYTLVDSSGNPILGANGAAEQFSPSQLTGIGTQ